MNENAEFHVPQEPDGYVRTSSLSAVVKWLVIVAMIGLLFALLIPFLLNRRDTARRSMCVRNLKQIGLACHGFHDKVKRFPASQWSSTRGFGWSWLTYLLPYMEEGTLFDSLNVHNNPLTVDAAMTARPNAFVCPNYVGPAFVADGRGGITNYKAMGATTKESLAFHDPAKNGNAPYATADRHPDGASIPGRQLRMADFSDGLSNTVFVGETVEEKAAVWQDGMTATLVGFPNAVNSQLVQPCDPQASGHYAYYHFTNFTVGLYGERSTVASSTRAYLAWDYGGDDGPYQDAEYVHGLSSEHPGGVNHLFGDACVRCISTNIDPSLYWFITTRNGGDPGSEFFVFP
ncbi:MAG: DUF1559 domain-containing protein [Patescibacteria group bacterium]|nr:DUF1559 domain-containing protein [Patescibacteria group bacterium]